MLNFNFKPCVPDGKDTFEIAHRIKKRCLKKNNKLEPLLKMSFTSTIKSVNIEKILNFPILTLNQLRKRITLGSFKIKQSKSYIPQIAQHSQAYILDQNILRKYFRDENILNELDNSNIFAFLIPSRHKRGKKPPPKTCQTKKKISKNKIVDSDPKNFKTYYKVFIQINPINDTNIKPYRKIKSKMNFKNISCLFNIFNIFSRIRLQLFSRTTSCRLLRSCVFRNLLSLHNSRTNCKKFNIFQITFSTFE